MHLIAFTLCMLLATIASAQQAAPTIRLHRGLVITRSVRIAPDRYALRADTGVQHAVIIIRGNDIDVDFAHAELAGAVRGAEPDESRGLAIFVDGGKNITIRNAKIRGYRVAIRASRTRNLRLID